MPGVSTVCSQQATYLHTLLHAGPTFFAVAGPQAHIQLLVVDIEGGELSVLRSIDWDNLDIHVVVFEADNQQPAKDAAVRNLMSAAGLWGR